MGVIDAGLSRAKKLSAEGEQLKLALETLRDQTLATITRIIPHSPGDAAFIATKIGEAFYIATRVLERDPVNVSTEPPPLVLPEII